MQTSVYPKNLSVMVIEDDPAAREILSFFLKELGIEDCIECSNGLQAVDFMRCNPTWNGIILCDWNMPRMTGAEFFCKIKTTHPHLPFIMVTGRNDEDSVLLAKDHGIFAYLLKPVNLTELDRKLHRMMGHYGTGLHEPFMTAQPEEVYEKAYTI